MRAYARRYGDMHDARAIFSEAYALLTHTLALDMPKFAWKDPAWVVHLAEVFAQRYFDAADAYDAGRLEHSVWLTGFEAMHNKNTSVLEALIFGMTCHIVHDLPLSLCEASFQEGSPNERIADYHLVNESIAATIDEVFNVISRRYNPTLYWLETLGKRNEDILTNYGVRIARCVAWYNACRLLSSARADASRAIVKSTEIIIADILNPPSWSLGIFAKILRSIAALGVRWPKHG